MVVTFSMSAILFLQYQSTLQALHYSVNVSPHCPHCPHSDIFFSFYLRAKFVCPTVLRKQNSPKHQQQQKYKKDPKKWLKFDQLCIFVFKNPNLAQSLTKFAQLYGCTFSKLCPHYTKQ